MAGVSRLENTLLLYAGKPVSTGSKSRYPNTGHKLTARVRGSSLRAL